jgi:magnesium transporter
MSTLVRSLRRLSWLTVNILLNIAAASVIALYQDTLAQVIALAVLLYTGTPYLGAVVGAALAMNTLIAMLIGGTVPLLPERLAA